ncbi:MAG: HAD family hydrolase [Lachnospiraceae bacterium]|nr:HAD family hydrolase [Lachnospiraceae bacterium]
MKADIKLIIFDFDGTIADTNKTIVEAKRATSILLGLEPLSDEEYASTIGMPSTTGFRKNYPDISDELAEKCKYEYRRLFEEIKIKTPPVIFEGIREVLDTLRDNQLICTIATSRNNKSLNEFLDEWKIAGYFTYIIGGDDNVKAKPEPDPVLKTLEELVYSPENTLVVGDMPVDIMMGKSAGVYTCGVTYGNSDRDKLIETGADFVIDDIRELVDIVI